ncbi:MAG: pyridoxamine kinase [Oscillospiraceae bacterium]|nr:pyridoxamine kinase [Oscillospiraceae bacterium]
MQKQKRVAAIHDISCFGRCSLTVALPVLSAAGIEAPVIPTAVLSTHTGGFTGFTYRDLTEDIRPVVDHWMTLGLGFDAVYTGFLGSIEQIGIVADCFGLLRTSGNPLVVVDPVMADHGELYSIFPKGFPAEMCKLCAMADVIVPNITEACLLLDAPYRDGKFSEPEIKDMLIALSRLGPRQVVITGISYNEETLGSASYNADTGEAGYACEALYPMYHGTGDLFASVLTSALVQGVGLTAACSLAARFTVDSIARTTAMGADNRFGVDFEYGLADLRGLIAGALSCEK